MARRAAPGRVTGTYLWSVLHLLPLAQDPTLNFWFVRQRSVADCVLRKQRKHACPARLQLWQLWRLGASVKGVGYAQRLAKQVFHPLQLVELLRSGNDAITAWSKSWRTSSPSAWPRTSAKSRRTWKTFSQPFIGL